MALPTFHLYDGIFDWLLTDPIWVHKEWRISLQVVSSVLQSQVCGHILLYIRAGGIFSTASRLKIPGFAIAARFLISNELT